MSSDQVKIIEFVIGLPGSGKTFLLVDFAKQGYDVYDDIKSLDEIKVISPTSNYICLSSPMFCDNEILLRAVSAARVKFSNAVPFFTFFENDPENCWKNIQRRNDGRLISKDFLYQLSKMYDTTYRNYVIPVYKDE